MRFPIFVILLLMAFFQGGAFAEQPQQLAPTTLAICGWCNLNEMIDAQNSMLEATSGRAQILRSSGDLDSMAGIPPATTLAGPTGTPNKADLENKILLALKGMDHSAPLIIYVSDHGFNDGSTSPSKTGFVLWADENKQGVGVKLSVQDFGDLLKKADLVGAGKPPLRIVGDYCYSGSIHSLAEKFPNVCSSAVVEAASEGNIGFGAPFWQTVATTAKKGGRPSFSEAYSSGMSLNPDAWRNSTGRLSSTNFAQEVLAKNGQDQAVAFMTDQMTGFGRLDQALNHYLNPPPLMEDSATEKTSLSVSLLVTEKFVCGQPGLFDDQQWSKLNQSVTDVLAQVPANIPKIYQDALSDLSKNQAQEHSLLSQFRDAFEKLQEKWSGMSAPEQEQNAASWQKALHPTSHSSADLSSDPQIQKFYQIEHDPELRKYLWELMMFDQYQKLKKFFEIASPTEIETFRRLSDCEGLPL